MIRYLRFGAALLAALGCSREAQSGKTARAETASAGGTPAPAVATVDTATVEAPLSLPSQLYVEHDATVYARSAGVVESIMVDLGRRVAPGQVLARLESTDQLIALNQAKEKFANTKQMVERQRALATAGVVTRADSEQVEFEHRQALLGLQKAQRDYDLTRIVAPFAGVITARVARVQRLVNPGDSLFRVTALEPVLAAVHLPETVAADIRPGANAQVLGPGGRSAAARVIRASPIIDGASGTRELIVQLSSGSRLLPGSSVTVRLGAQRRQVVTIPKGAVAREGYALVWEDNRTTLRAVTLGTELEGGRVEVLSGLTPGEKVVESTP
jgi:membrane fusion protein, multidrug efflux system